VARCALGRGQEALGAEEQAASAENLPWQRAETGGEGGDGVRAGSTWFGYESRPFSPTKILVYVCSGGAQSQDPIRLRLPRRCSSGEEEDGAVWGSGWPPARPSAAVAASEAPLPSVTLPRADTSREAGRTRAGARRAESRRTRLSGGVTEAPRHLFNAGGNPVRAATEFGASGLNS